MNGRFLLVIVSLLFGALACAGNTVALEAVTPQVSTPVPVGNVPVEQNTPSAGEPSATPIPPEATATPAAYVPPADTPTEQATSVIQQPPTETPAASVTPANTDTPPPVPATETPVPPTATPPAPISGAITTGIQPIVSGVNFVQTTGIGHEGGELIGRPQDMADKRNETWASLRGGNAAWILDLGSAQNVAGLKLYAQRDGRDATTFIKIEVSGDGNAWIEVWNGSGECGVPKCETLEQKVFTELGFGPARAQFIRLTSGPTRFAFGEIQIAVLP
ncbi:MAG: discoidin domain-containing protein [Anaerolineales bacterium]|nr:discoidin domain-containing protein [Anaerolineales bacterium]